MHGCAPQPRATLAAEPLGESVRMLPSVMMEHCPRCNAELASEANYCARCGASVAPAVAAPARDQLIGSVILGRYRVERVLAEGGMGKVYLAQQAMGQATRPVALKTLRPELMGDPKVSGRFMRESEIVIRLAHPNTIQFYDFGRLDDGTMVIVMEYIEGRTLADELNAGPLSLERVDALLAQICGSLAEAHAHGIVHRDLKPQNVLLTARAGRDDFVKVVDFGIALHRSEEEDPTRLTTHGTLVGTPPYMSPEQFQDRDVDARSDVYSLGVMLYRMLTGALPFEAKNTWQWAAAHIDQPPRPFAEHLATRALPERRASAVMRALAKNPDDRPRDAGELLREFSGRDAMHVPAAPGDASPAAGGGVHPAAASGAVTPSTLHAERTPRRTAVAWLSWLPVGLLVAAGAVMAWRGAALDAPAREAEGGDSVQRRRAAAARPRRTSPKVRPEQRREAPAAADVAGPAHASDDAGRAGAATPSRRQSPQEDEGEPAAARVLGQAAAALENGKIEPAMSAFADAQRALGRDHPALQSLEPRLSELAAIEAQRLADGGQCELLTALSARLAALGIAGADAVGGAAAECKTPVNSRSDGGNDSTVTE